MRKLIAAGIVTAVLALGGGVAFASVSHGSDPAVSGGRFCVQYGTNVVAYDWDSLPCQSGWYLDQLTYNEAAPTATATVTVTPTTAGDVVTVNNPGTLNVSDSTSFSQALAASSSKGYAISTWYASGLPACLSLNATSGVFSGTCSSTDNGTYDVSVTAVDTNGVSGTTTFTVNVS